MRIAVAADIHGCWESVKYPKADVLVIAGDLCENTNAEGQVDELFEFNKFAKQLKKDKYKEIILVAGNHDFCFELLPCKSKSVIPEIIYLQDSSVEIDNFKFYGSPWQPWFWDWAFNFPDPQKNFFKARAHARRVWDAVPKDINILITHGPPYRILDEAKTAEQVGCPYLLDRINELEQLKLHIFGHVHYSKGIRYLNKKLFVHATICPGYTKQTRPIRVINIEK